MSSTIAFRAIPAGTRIGLITVFAFCVLLPFHALASPADDDILVVGAKGDVRITMDGAPRAAAPGSTLSLPAVVQTGHDGSVDLRQGETTIGIGPDTRLEFPAPAQSAGPLERVAQPRGNAFYDVSPREGRRFRVETPYLVAVIKGTQFNVAADADSTTISLFEGRLEVQATDGDAVVMLNAGEIATRRRGEEAIRVLRLADEKAAFAVPGEAGSGETTSDLIPPDPAEPMLDGLPDGSPLDDEVDDVFTPADTDTSTGAIDGDIGIDVGDNIGSLAGAGVDADLDVSAGGLDAGLTADLDLGDGDGGADVGADIDLGGASTDLGADAELDLGAGTIDAGLDAGADLGAGSLDVGADAGVDLDGGSVDAGVDADVLGTDASVDLGLDLSGDDAGLDVGIDLGLGNEPVGESEAESEESGGLLDGLLQGRGLL